MLKEAMTHRLKIEIFPERQTFDTSINNIDFDDFDLSKYDRRLRLNARVQTDKQVLQHELFPDMFDEVAPTSQLYEHNEADAQTTRYVAKELDDEKFSDAISDKTEGKNQMKQKMNQKTNQKMKSRKIYKVFFYLERGREERGKPRNKVVKKHIFRWRRQECV